MDDELQVKVQGLSREELDVVLADLDAAEPEGAAAAVDPVIGALIIIGIVAGAKLVMRIINERRGGVVADLSKTPVEVRRDKALPYGTFLILGADGSVRLETVDEPEDSLERMWKALLEAVLPSKEEIQAIVDEYLGS